VSGGSLYSLRFHLQSVAIMLLSFLSLVLDGIRPHLAWGVFLRLLGLLASFACFMLARQVRAWGGERGMFPIKTRLARLRVDTPSLWRRILSPPTVHWLAASDAALQAWLYGAAAIGLVCTVLGLCSRLGFAVMFIVYVSYSNLMNLMYPWDCLLMESLFLAIFLPLASPFSLSLPTLPIPLLCLAFKFLIFRLMFGFGKFKFIGASTREFSYLKGFLINQPMPTIFGRLMYHLPLAVHVGGLVVFFLSEIVVPFIFLLASGAWRVGAAWTTIALMIAIFTTGNFGFFNTLAAILCIPLLDPSESMWREGSFIAGLGLSPSALSITPISSIFVCFVLCSLLLLSLAFIPFNSWCTTSFFIWPGLAGTKPNKFLQLLRTLAPFHLVHAYGVFFPHSSPGIRWVPIFEGTDDPRANDLYDAETLTMKNEYGHAADNNDADDGGIVWRPYDYIFMTSRTDRMPSFCAPWHQRLDQAILYESIGMGPDGWTSTLNTGCANEFNPRMGSSMLQRVAAGLIQGNRDIEELFGQVPFSSRSESVNGRGKVQAIRISFYLYAPTDISTLLNKSLKDGSRLWWSRRYMGHHCFPITRRSVERCHDSLLATNGFARHNYAQLQTREPEMAHPEHYLAVCHTPAVKQLFGSLEQAVAVMEENRRRGEKESTGLGSTSLIATPVTQAIMAEHSHVCLVQPISRDMVENEFWASFIQRLQPLRQSLQLPDELAKADGELLPPSVPRLDCLSHMPAGAWSRAITRWLRGDALSGLPPCFANMDAAAMHAMEKITARATLLLVRRLIPLYHGPQPDEMMTMAQVEEFLAKHQKDSNGDSTGASIKHGCCIRPCARDRCPHSSTHLHLPSFFHLYIFAQHILLQGRHVFDEVLAEPCRSLNFIRSFTVSTGLLLSALFHPQSFSIHAAKMRLIRQVSYAYQLEHGSILPGFLMIYYNFLSHEYRNVEEGSLAMMPAAHLPAVHRPQRYDQCWRVDWAGSKVDGTDRFVAHDAPFLAMEDRAQLRESEAGITYDNDNHAPSSTKQNKEH